MRNRFLILILLPLINFSQENLIKIGKSINEIEFGYSTLADVKEIYSSEIITDTITYNCPHTDECGTAYSKLNSLFIKKLGVLFQANYEDGQLIKQIRLYSPFRAEIDNKMVIELGKTNVKEVYKSFDNLILTSTNTKDYWIIKNDKITFLVSRLTTDNDYPIEYTEIEDRLVKVVILNPERKVMDINYVDGCRIPLFAPKTETHRNCYVSKIKGIIYYINIGDDSSHKSVENGYWKKYYPNHIIKEEGNYKKGKKSGEFKYYNEKGILIKTKRHRRFLIW